MPTDRTVADTDAERVHLATGQGAERAHLEPDCKSLRCANRQITRPAADYAGRLLCSRCDPEFTATPDNDLLCAGCEARLDADGRCWFCDWYDGVVADAPDPPENAHGYDWSVWMRSAIQESNAEVSHAD